MGRGGTLKKIQTAARVNPRHRSVFPVLLNVSHRGKKKDLKKKTTTCPAIVKESNYFLKRALLYFVDPIETFHINHRVGGGYVTVRLKKTKSIFSCKSLFSSPPEKKRKKKGNRGEFVKMFSLDLKIQIFVYFRVSDFCFLFL